MRFLKKKKAVCFILLLSVVLLIMFAQIFVLDITRGFRETTSHFGLQHFIPLPNPQSSFYLDSTTQSTRETTTIPPKCLPVHNIAFVKTHKAGSSTIANILTRYGMNNHLNFALPNNKFHSPGYNYITKPGRLLTRDRIIPLQPGQEYNILYNHCIYNRTAFREIMPGNTTYITILRQPFQQFVSAFEYYGIAKLLANNNKDILTAENPISEYLKNPYKYDRGVSYFSYIKNKQAEDLGFSREEYLNSTKMTLYLDQMDADFSLVMLMERFDESLLLLKHELCWEIKDILYIPQNANTHKPKRQFSEENLKQHRRMNHLDYTLYSHYERVFDEKIQKQGPDFFNELDHFKKLLSDVRQGCMNGTFFNVPENKWHEAFQVTKEDCSLLFIPELRALDILLQQARATQSPQWTVALHREAPAKPVVY